MLFLVTRRWCQQHQPRPWFSAETYHPSTPKVGFFQKRWYRFRSHTLPRKAAAVGGLGLKTVTAFVAVCCAVHLIQSPFVFRSFTPEPEKDYLLEAWADIEPTLKEGDIVLMRGRGLMSWAITTAQYALSLLMHASALRYSHVAVVVAPVEYAETQNEEAQSHRARWWAPWRGRGTSPFSSKKSSAVSETLSAETAAASARRTITRGALILEAMDNGEYHVPDINGVIRYDQVQVVEASKRLFSQSAQGEPAYHYFSVRRLEPYSLVHDGQATNAAGTSLAAFPENDIHGRPPHPHGGSHSDGGATPPSASYLVLSPSELVGFSRQTQDARTALQHFIADNLGRPMDPSPLYVVSFLSPALYSWLRPGRDAHSEVSCSELIVELYQRMGLLRRHWRWEPLTTEEEYKATHSLLPQPTSTRAALRSVPPSPLDDINRHTRLVLAQEPQQSAEELEAAARAESRRGARVWEKLYCRADLRAARRREWRLPLVRSGESIDGPPELLRTAREVFVCAPRHGVAQTVPLDLVLSDSTAGELNPDVAAALSRGSAYQTQRQAPRAQLLHAGLVRPDATGKLHQLRWRYKHVSLQTTPYQFTEAGDKYVLDWRSPFKLGREEFVAMTPERFTFADTCSNAH